jgi:putative hemolysin
MKIKAATAIGSELISLPGYLTYKQKHLNLPAIDISEGRFNVRLANTPEEVAAALHLRYKVFNVELGNQPESAFGIEKDEFDSTSHHLIATLKDTGEVIGVYRLRTLEMAKHAGGFYSSQEFQLENLPEDVLARSVEIGRACIAKQYRNKSVLFLLWKGLASYVMKTKKRYLFGCCSLFTQDYAVGKKAWQQILRDGYLHETFRVKAQDDYAFTPQEKQVPDLTEELEVPKLFRSYLRIGTKVCSEPVIDRKFKTIDFFVICDVAKLDGRYKSMFFGE